MAPHEKHAPKTERASYQSRDQPSFDGRGDPRRRQYNTDNLSSQQLAPNLADSASNIGNTVHPTGFRGLTTMTIPDEDTFLGGAAVPRTEYEQNYTFRRLPSSFGTTVTSQTDQVARMSDDGRRNAHWDLARNDGFIIVNPEEPLNGNYASTPRAESGISALELLNLHYMGLGIENSHKDHTGAWVDNSRSRLVQYMIPELSTNPPSPSVQSRRSSFGQGRDIVAESLPIEFAGIGDRLAEWHPETPYPPDFA
jgi:hypothetical protein